MSAQLITKKPIGHRFVFSLALAVFGTGMLDVLSSLFLVDIAKTFLGDSSLSSIAIVSQIIAISSIATAVFGVLGGFLSVKINHKKLLLFGASCIVIGATGCFLAPNLFYMELFYPFDGIGTVIVVSMAFTLVGESLPLDKRGKSIGAITAGGIISSAIGFLVAGQLGSVGNWRSYLFWYVMPISLIAFLLVYASIPSNSSSKHAPEQILAKDHFKEIFKNKSAISCFLGYVLMGIAAMWVFFAPTFWRNQYAIPVELVGTITMITVVVHAAGSIIGGRLVDFVGRRTIVVASWTIRGILVSAIVISPSFWIAFVISCLFMFDGGISVASIHSLSVEQVGKSKGTMMSLSIVFGNIGTLIGASLGGLILGNFGFQIVGITFGLINVIGALVILFLAKDPTNFKNTARQN